MKGKVKLAYQAVRRVHGPYTADRIVADPVLNSSFLGECRQIGLTHSDFELNWCLLNLRKSGELSALGKSKKTAITGQDEYRFAAEMAARFLERRDGVTLDMVICDPLKAKEFDELARRLAPGYSSLEYRVAALSLRKAKKLAPELVLRALEAASVTRYRVQEMVLSGLPDVAGVYLFFGASETLYVGESHNLRLRLKKHLDHSDNKALAQWMWEFGAESLFVEFHVLALSTKALRRAVEEELIRTRRPVFNIQRS
jgi:predicted GIY-YIG superfamily endonuclease